MPLPFCDFDSFFFVFCHPTTQTYLCHKLKSIEYVSSFEYTTREPDVHIPDPGHRPHDERRQRGHRDGATSGIDYWIYGHSHRNIDKTIGTTHCLCNQFGYVSHNEHLTFDRTKIIEI